MSETFESLRLVPKADGPLSAKDFKTDQEVRWCPGCGDYAILNVIQSFMPELGIERERKYFDIACRRIEQAYAQPRLFEDAKVGAGETAHSIARAKNYNEALSQGSHATEHTKLIA